MAEYDDVAAENWDAFTDAYDKRHEDFVKHANKCDEFYVGDQWDKDTLLALEAAGRPALTINLAQSTINAILGHYSTTRADILYKPKKQVTEEHARVFTKLGDQILESNSFPVVEGTVFADGLVTDRGFFDTRLDFNDNQFGEIRIVSKDPRCVVLDPSAKDYDPSEWSQVFTFDWHSLEDIELLYGKADTPGDGWMFDQVDDVWWAIEPVEGDEPDEATAGGIMYVLGQLAQIATCYGYW